MKDRLLHALRPSNQRLRRAIRVAGIGIGVSGLLVVVLWIAIHRVPWLGPLMADSVRAVVGPTPVAWAEDVAYGWQDRLNRWRYGNDDPHTYWEVPEGVVKAGMLPPTSPANALLDTGLSGTFPPKSFEPPHSHVASRGDGIWVPAREYGMGISPLVKTMVHPDSERPYTVVALVAMDLTRVRLHAAAGTHEPRDPSFPKALRTGIIPQKQVVHLLAAFNGGFQTIHGGYGMMIDGHRIGEPRKDACTVAIYPDGAIRIRSWSLLSSEVEKMAAYRQAPPCLIEQGDRHLELDNRYATSWGAMVNRGTVIRRSALGISADGKILYFGMGDGLTARSLADGMKIAGAHDVAQLDVNYVFPRFVFFEKSGGEVEAVEPLCRGFSFSPKDYVRSPMIRDFFYITSRFEE